MNVESLLVSSNPTIDEKAHLRDHLFAIPPQFELMIIRGSLGTSTA